MDKLKRLQEWVFAESELLLDVYQRPRRVVGEMGDAVCYDRASDEEIAGQRQALAKVLVEIRRLRAAP